MNTTKRKEDFPEAIQEYWTFLREYNALKLSPFTVFLGMGLLVWFVHEVMALPGAGDSPAGMALFAFLTMYEISFIVGIQRVIKDQNYGERKDRLKLYAICNLPLWVMCVVSVGTGYMVYLAWANELNNLAAAYGATVIYSLYVWVVSKDYLKRRLAELQDIYVKSSS